MSALPGMSDLVFLVVEDQGFQRWAMTTHLETLGARHVHAAADGRSALELLRDSRPSIDVVVTDLDMPGMDGMEFIRHIGELNTRAALIVSSGLDRSLVDSVETMARAYGLNFLGTIEKPVTANELRALISRYRQLASAPPRPPAPRRLEEDEVVVALRAERFEPFFQPKVLVSTGELVGAEALARWRHPDRGVLLPEDFIPQLEATGQIGGLTELMLRKALATCRPWLRSRFQAAVAVNLSLSSLSDVTLADRMLEIARELGVEPHNVLFEVTESAAASDLGRSLENLLRLRMKGFGLSIDDYGTGYSSMQQLSRIAFTELKIDQTFLRDAAARQTRRVILASGLEIAQKLGITAVSEGVESRDEWDLLKALGCPVAQGFFIARPMEASRFLRWVEEWRPRA
jgi:EAL domain-containing protein (putative c-di-GMP-specific phosphodiesterase class I)/CheY-like chemotaxis protein